MNITKQHRFTVCFESARLLFCDIKRIAPLACQTIVIIQWTYQTYDLDFCLILLCLPHAPSIVE